jgi:hypothetical protein
MPADAAAFRASCEGWAKESLPDTSDKTLFTGAKHSCIFVPDKLEADAKLFNSADESKIKSDSVLSQRRQWLSWFILRVFTHEVKHEQFLSHTMPVLVENSCAETTIRKDMSELAAIISEFPVVNKLPNDMQKAWFTAVLKDQEKETSHNQSITGSIKQIRCSCSCKDSDQVIKDVFKFSSTGWSEEELFLFHHHLKAGIGKQMKVYWPFETPIRKGSVGKNELSLSGAVGFSGSKEFLVSFLTYRRVLWSLADGRARLRLGADINIPGLVKSNALGELGGVTGGIEFIQRPTSHDQSFGGFRGRVDTGVGYGNFLIRPGDANERVQSGSSLILEVGAGAQFYIPTSTGRFPISGEIFYRVAEPRNGDAEKIQSFGLKLKIDI